MSGLHIEEGAGSGTTQSPVTSLAALCLSFPVYKGANPSAPFMRLLRGLNGQSACSRINADCVLLFLFL